MSSSLSGKKNILGRCSICGSERLLSKALNVCGGCLSRGSEGAMRRAVETHKLSRSRFSLPAEPPSSKSGVRCGICSNDCVMSIGERGYCGLTINKDGKLLRLAGTAECGLLEFYYDPLPTNCVAEWCCPAGTGSGYPNYAYRNGPEYGYFNLAVFYGACSFDCLFCQNWHYKKYTMELNPLMSASDLASKVNDKTACICYFGGDPAPQLPHSIRTSEIALERSRGRILRVCLETNGSEDWAMLKRAADLSLSSGGCIKFDIKAFSESLNIALCGVSNRRTIENFRRLSGMVEKRPKPPFLVASTLLVPGYVEVEEVRRIAAMIASLNPAIPYSLLAFSPHYLMNDLPRTSLRVADECLRAAQSAGLQHVRIGNVNLLSEAR